MLIMLGCGGFVSVTHLGAIPADAHMLGCGGFDSVTYPGVILMLYGCGSQVHRSGAR